MTNNETKKGTVKWFNDTKGFGFIAQETGGEDVFVHYSAIATDGYRSLREGQEVQFELAKADKGWRAANVRPSGADEPDEATEVSADEAAALDSLMGEN